jgi:hypothetical protein
MLLSVPDPEAGTITMWAGLVTGVPPGWAICDGTNGTPDLREKFIRCNGALFAVGQEGGSVSHTHGLQYDAHEHTTASGMGITAGAHLSNTTGQAIGTLLTDAASNIPPAYRLAYIMRLP